MHGCQGDVMKYELTKMYTQLNSIVNSIYIHFSATLSVSTARDNMNTCYISTYEIKYVIALSNS